MISPLILSLILNIQETPDDWTHEYNRTTSEHITYVCKAEKIMNDKAQLYLSAGEWKYINYEDRTYNYAGLRMPVDGKWIDIDLTEEEQKLLVDEVFTCESQLSTKELKNISF